MYNHDITESTKQINNTQINVFGEEYILRIKSIYSGYYSDVVDDHKCDTVEFKPPLVVTCFKDNKTKSKFSISYDFGLNYILKDKDAGFLMPLTSNWKEKAKSHVIFHLEHAFFHTSMDPNYGTLHYALYGCLCMGNRAMRISPTGFCCYIP